MSKVKSMDLLNNLAVSVWKKVNWLSYNSEHYEDTKLIDHEITEFGNDGLVLSMFLSQHKIASKFRVNLLFQKISEKADREGDLSEVIFKVKIAAKNFKMGNSDGVLKEKIAETFSIVVNGKSEYLKNFAERDIDEGYIAKDVFRAIEMSKGKFKVRVTKIVVVDEEYFATSEEEALEKALAEHRGDISGYEEGLMYNEIETKVEIVEGK